jgi:hypothetical protein
MVFLYMLYPVVCYRCIDRRFGGTYYLHQDDETSVSIYQTTGCNIPEGVMLVFIWTLESRTFSVCIFKPYCIRYFFFTNASVIMD